MCCYPTPANTAHRSTNPAEAVQIAAGLCPADEVYQQAGAGAGTAVDGGCGGGGFSAQDIFNCGSSWCKNISHSQSIYVNAKGRCPFANGVEVLPASGGDGSGGFFSRPTDTFCGAGRSGQDSGSRPTEDRSAHIPDLLSSTIIALRQHTGWPICDVAPLPPVAAAAAAVAPAGSTMSTDVRNEFTQGERETAELATPTMTRMAEVAAGRPVDVTRIKESNKHGAEAENNDVTYGNDVNDADDIDVLLRSGGSPCLPMEEGWALSSPACRVTHHGACGNGCDVPAITDSSDGLTGQWQTPFVATSCSNFSFCNSNILDLKEDIDEGQVDVDDNPCYCEKHRHQQSRHRAAASPPPMFRHRACQLGYMDSAPAHAMVAAASPPASARVIFNFTLAFLGGSEAAAWRQALGTTLSAPPGATAAAAAAREPGTAAAAVATASRASPVLTALERAVLRPLMLESKGPTRDGLMFPRGSNPREVNRLPDAGFDFTCDCTIVSPAMAAAVAAAAMTSAPAAAAAALDMQKEMTDSSTHRASVIAESSISTGSEKGPSFDGFFGTPLADGWTPLLDNLRECSSPLRASLEKGKQQQQQQQPVQQEGHGQQQPGQQEGHGQQQPGQQEGHGQQQPGQQEGHGQQQGQGGPTKGRAPAHASSARRVGRGLLACFMGEGLAS